MEISTTKRLKFTVAYDGTPYVGWQVQPGGTTVQELVEKALVELTGTFSRIHASGRTDAGVHALGQVFHVDISATNTIPIHHWPRAINTKLPPSIRIVNVENVSSDFHSRFSAIKKTYQYRISTEQIHSPFHHKKILHYPYPNFNLTLLEKCIQSLQGEHDFYAFCAKRGNEPTPLPLDYCKRTLFHTELLTEENQHTITFTGNGFLYKMVRLMVGASLATASGKIPYEDFLHHLKSPQGRKTKYAAPPEGLYLTSVDY